MIRYNPAKMERKHMRRNKMESPPLDPVTTKATHNPGADNTFLLDGSHALVEVSNEFRFKFTTSTARVSI